MHSEALNYLSIATGWVYFVAWSVSFYPQVYTNWRRKSVEGLSFEYLMHNITGHTFYCSFSVVMYLYAQPKYHLDEEVKMNDMAFGMHAVLLTLITIGQCLVYDRGGQTLSRPHMAVCALVWLGLGIDIILAAAGLFPWVDDTPGHSPAWTSLQYLGVAKSFLSFIKCVPQVLLNRQRRSTVGWSIGNILLDITGGTLSLVQNFIDAYNKSEWDIFTGNIPKLMLAIVTIFFDLIFIVQHYVLYPDHGEAYEPIPERGGNINRHSAAKGGDPNFPAKTTSSSLNASDIERGGMFFGNTKAASQTFY
eukprot:TRINITY_DN3332_c0_g1_i2.p1 TRINITY_DN3332_c0_g1~~TRINITY_DN3332_c0_g1_i2.p1  ORF type:complete len:306 (-),score=63.29 TRINITY_DN3332_c0_g1_i2:349-1266(-)